jgi:hypothetical protein
VENKNRRIRRVKYWEIIANKIIHAGFSVGWVSALDDYGRTVWIVDAHRDGERHVVRAEENLTALLESVIRKNCLDAVGRRLTKWRSR